MSAKPEISAPAGTSERDDVEALAVALARRDAIKRRVWMAAIWSWPVCIIGAGLAFALGAGFVPPPSPAWSARELAAYFDAHHTGIRIGVLVAMFATALMLPYLTVVSAEIKKIEGRLGLLAPIQFGGAVMLVMLFQVIGLAWLSATYRPEADPDVIRAFNDYTWFAWSTFIATYSIQYLCMAIVVGMSVTCVLMHRRARYEAGKPSDRRDPEFSDLALL